MNAEIDHDALGKQLDGEPHLLLLARDPLAEHVVRFYAALRGRKFTKVREIVANAMVAAQNIPMHPTKDSEHSISASQVANAMMNWRYTKHPHGPTNARDVDLGDLPIPPLSVMEAEPAS